MTKKVDPAIDAIEDRVVQMGVVQVRSPKTTQIALVTVLRSCEEGATVSAMARYLGITRRTVKATLLALAEQGLVVEHGSTTARHWTVT